MILISILISIKLFHNAEGWLEFYVDYLITILVLLILSVQFMFEQKPACSFLLLRHVAFNFCSLSLYNVAEFLRWVIGFQSFNRRRYSVQNLHGQDFRDGNVIPFQFLHSQRSPFFAIINNYDQFLVSRIETVLNAST